MEALEAQVTGTNLPGFVSAGVVQPDQRAAQAGTAAADASAAPGKFAQLWANVPPFNCHLHVSVKGNSGRVNFVTRWVDLLLDLRPFNRSG